MAAPIKAGVKSSEFWATVVFFLGGVSDMLQNYPHQSSWVQMASVILAGAATITYTGSRTALKVSAMKAGATVLDELADAPAKPASGSQVVGA